jgi:hypothetical protein
MNPYLLLAADNVGMGRIQGGWEYVWVSYGITWASVGLYALYLWNKTRAARSAKEG